MEALGINLPKLIYQILNFAAMAGILYVLLYKPVFNMLTERRKRIEESLQQADRMREQTQSAQVEYEQELARARQEAAQILAQAQERARSQEFEIVAQARKEADRLRSEGLEQARIEREQMLRDVRAQLADVVALTASKVLQAEVSAKKHEKLIDESLAVLSRQN
jgi:F-type H+-transporting ATPase subunit b